MCLYLCLCLSLPMPDWVAGTLKSKDSLSRSLARLLVIYALFSFIHTVFHFIYIHTSINDALIFFLLTSSLARIICQVLLSYEILSTLAYDFDRSVKQAQSRRLTSCSLFACSN